MPQGICHFIVNGPIVPKAGKLYQTKSQIKMEFEDGFRDVVAKPLHRGTPMMFLGYQVIENCWDDLETTYGGMKNQIVFLFSVGAKKGAFVVNVEPELPPAERLSIALNTLSNYIKPV